MPGLDASCKETSLAILNQSHSIFFNQSGGSSCARCVPWEPRSWRPLELSLSSLSASTAESSELATATSPSPSKKNGNNAICSVSTINRFGLTMDVEEKNRNSGISVLDMALQQMVGKRQWKDMQLTVKAEVLSEVISAPILDAITDSKLITATMEAGLLSDTATSQGKFMGYREAAKEKGSPEKDTKGRSPFKCQTGVDSSFLGDGFTAKNNEEKKHFLSTNNVVTLSSSEASKELTGQCSPSGGTFQSENSTTLLEINDNLMSPPMAASSNILPAGGSRAGGSTCKVVIKMEAKDDLQDYESNKNAIQIANAQNINMVTIKRSQEANQSAECSFIDMSFPLVDRISDEHSGSLCRQDITFLKDSTAAELLVIAEDLNIPVSIPVGPLLTGISSNNQKAITHSNAMENDKLDSLIIESEKPNLFAKISEQQQPSIQKAEINFDGTDEDNNRDNDQDNIQDNKHVVSGELEDVYLSTNCPSLMAIDVDESDNVSKRLRDLNAESFIAVEKRRKVDRQLIPEVYKGEHLEGIFNSQNFVNFDTVDSIPLQEEAVLDCCKVMTREDLDNPPILKHGGGSIKKRLLLDAEVDVPQEQVKSGEDITEAFSETPALTLEKEKEEEVQFVQQETKSWVNEWEMLDYRDNTYAGIGLEEAMEDAGIEYDKRGSTMPAMSGHLERKGPSSQSNSLDVDSEPIAFQEGRDINCLESSKLIENKSPSPSSLPLETDSDEDSAVAWTNVENILASVLSPENDDFESGCEWTDCVKLSPESSQKKTNEINVQQFVATTGEIGSTSLSPPLLNVHDSDGKRNGIEDIQKDFIGKEESKLSPVELLTQETLEVEDGVREIESEKGTMELPSSISGVKQETALEDSVERSHRLPTIRLKLPSGLARVFGPRAGMGQLEEKENPSEAQNRNKRVIDKLSRNLLFDWSEQNHNSSPASPVSPDFDSAYSKKNQVEFSNYPPPPPPRPVKPTLDEHVENSISNNSTSRLCSDNNAPSRSRRKRTLICPKIFINHAFDSLSPDDNIPEPSSPSSLPIPSTLSLTLLQSPSPPSSPEIHRMSRPSISPELTSRGEKMRGDNRKLKLLPKGILKKRKQKHSCKCGECGCSVLPKAIRHSQQQLRLASKTLFSLLADLRDLRGVVEEELLQERDETGMPKEAHEPINYTKVESVIEKTYQGEKIVDQSLQTLMYRSKTFCGSSTEGKGKRKLRFADEVGEELCRIRVFKT